MAKSVPQRMAIISAGVVMNVIFAFLMAIVAYLMGVKEVACGVSAVEPGEAAWRADLHPGDQFVGIDDWSKRQLRFRDLRYAVALANLETGVNFEIKRVGVEKPFWITIKPDMKQGRLQPTIGVRMPMTTTLQEQYAVMPDSPAAAAGEFRPGDKIVAVGGQPVDSYADLDSQMARHPDEPLVFTVERTANGPGSSDEAAARRAHRRPSRAAADAHAGPGDEDGQDHRHRATLARRRGRHPRGRFHRRHRRFQRRAIRCGCPTCCAAAPARRSS